MAVRFALAVLGLFGVMIAPALAQRNGQDAEVNRLIEQLQPSGTRGIRVPGAAPAEPARTATTAPAGVPAVSITVRFPSGSADLTPEAERQLAALGQALSSQALASYRFRIEGHTDTVGSVELNQMLSERRAAAVRDHLTRRYGIDPARLESIGFGKKQLLVSTPDQTPEPRNRRVQVLNLGG